MAVYEILFEGSFVQDRLRTDEKPSQIEGFFALRQITARCLTEAVEEGCKAIRIELASEDSFLASNLKKVVPTESRELDRYDEQRASGFTFF